MTPTQQTEQLEGDLFSEDLRQRVDAVFRHVKLFDEYERDPVYHDDKKWLALVLVGLTHKAFELLMIEETIGDLRVSITAGVRGPLDKIDELERNALTGEAVMRRWPWGG